ncbi:MAG: AbrB/MazE/SpoVT family DNA-binding domain-containing protein [Verrucomicrobiae bacterium]|nr:AbrB/MazE/SpoVT family DNA-binding domain-containing protein [Verrucomicrobiae bacterium]
MLIKVFNKGRVVLPVDLHKALGIQVGDLLEVELDAAQKGL